MFAVVIPTLGRPSLAKAIESLERHTRKQFSIVVVNDSDSDISFKNTIVLQGPRVGWPGPTRNVGIRWAKDNGIQWVAFLDDDDYFHPKYMEWLYDHVHAFPTTDILIFRARGLFDHLPPTFVIPPKNVFQLHGGLVGNTFSIRVGDIEYDELHVNDDTNTNKYKHHGEDLRLLQDATRRKKVVFISPRVGYGVRMPIFDAYDEYPLVRV